MKMRVFRSYVSDIVSVLIWCLCMLLMHQVSHRTALALGGNETDQLALLSIKAQISYDPMLITSSWNSSLHFCQWKGVSCGLHHQRVTHLNLESCNLVGSLSPSIGNLSFLRVVNLSNNIFHGEIPHEISLLFRLRVLDLTDNSLEGQIPANLSHCNNLTSLNLDKNKFIGSPPKELGSLPKLVHFSIASNNLIGAIPSSFGNLSSLEDFLAGENMLEGSIPDSLGGLKSLKYLALSENKLSGMVPESIYNISSLTSFMARQNQLEGYLPRNIGLTLPNIQVLHISRNNFTGSIPLSISNASKLESLDLSRNKLSPRLAIDFGNLNDLSWLDLSVNVLGIGDDNDLNFISTFSNSSKLSKMYLDYNNFGCVFPNSIANLSTRLQAISVEGNHIFGSIPADIGNLVSLNSLDLHYNQLTGSIPTSIGRLHKLQEVGFGKNKLSGEIPSSLGNLTLLNQVWFEENDFQGNLPSSLGNCRSLLLLHLYGNNLSGSIPREVIGLTSLAKSLDLSLNSLSGPIPVEVGNLKNLVELNLAHNQLSGEIPSSLGSCVMLVHLSLDHNSLVGAIPQSLSSLKSIEELDLSHNNLTGEIPKYLGINRFLRNLNLSFNHLEGEVPEGGVFQNASAISVLENEKLCGGIPELQLPTCAINKRRKQKMSLEKALIIPIVCGGLGIVFVSSLLILCCLRKMRKKPYVAHSLMDLANSFSYEKLLKATNGFSSANLIGTGSFGSVYEGILHQNGKAIAVKAFGQHNRGASKSFMAECKALRNIRHQNLVKIVSACASVDFQGNDFKALVYEFMENGSLESWLHPLPQTGASHDKPKSLNLHQRLDIAIDVASALDYLHNHSHTPIIHCGIKPSNILLDEYMTAHVGDLGLARLLQKSNNELSQSHTSSVGLRGTIGYAAPEYGMGSEVSTNGDVYNYGILLLELFTGKRPTDDMFKDGMNLHKIAKTALSKRVVDQIVDQKLLLGVEEEEATNIQQMKRGKTHECLILILRIGVACSEESPRERITIAEAARGLHLIKDMLLERRTSCNVQTV